MRCTSAFRRPFPCRPLLAPSDPLQPFSHPPTQSHNILLTPGGEAKVADVGLARVLAGTYVSRLDGVAGTFAWAAPELLLGERCTCAADMYSFGVVMWEVATRARPGARGGRAGRWGGRRETDGGGPGRTVRPPTPSHPQPAARGQMRHLVPGELPDEAAALMRRCR